MQYNRDTVNANSAAPDEIVIKKYIAGLGHTRRYLQSKWKILLVAALIGGLIGIAYAFLRKTKYTAECTFVLEEGNQSGGGLGQYSALAAMAGIDMGNTSGGLFQGDNITQLYKSRLMLEKTLLVSVSFNNKKELLIDRYFQLNQQREHWGDNPKLRNIDFSIPKEKFTIVHDSLMKVAVDDIYKNYLSIDKPDKKLSMISIKTTSIDPLFSIAFTDYLVSNVNNFYVQTKTKKSLQNVALLQHHADSVHNVLNRLIGSAASAYDANPNPDPAFQQILRAPSQRKQIEVQAATTIYGEIIRNLEVAKGALQRETPLIQVIDKPVLPLPNDRVSKFKSAINGALLATIFGIFVLLTLRFYQKIMN